MYEYIQNDLIETTLKFFFQTIYVGRLLLTDVWTFAEMSLFGDQEEEDAQDEEEDVWKTDSGEVGDIGWEYEYEDCLTGLYRYLFQTDSFTESPTDPTTDLPPSPATIPTLPVPVPVPYPEKYNAEWKKRITSAEIQLKEHLHLSTLKHNVLFETTPFGNVIMYYDADKDSFIYFSDKTLSYPIVNAVGKKYALTFRCESLFNDVDTPIVAPLTTPAEDRAVSVPLQPPSGVQEKFKSSVFAKFKNYRDMATSSATSSAPIGVRPPYKNTSTVPVPSATNSSLRRLESEPHKEPPPKNRYTCEGKLANYNFLQKIAKIKPFSYKDFKRKTKPLTVISV
jgi:hypothetical protein